MLGEFEARGRAEFGTDQFTLTGQLPLGEAALLLGQRQFVAALPILTLEREQVLPHRCEARIRPLELDLQRGDIEPHHRLPALHNRVFLDEHLSDLGIDLRRSVVIGDRWRDIAVARAVGCRGILVKTGYGATEAIRPQPGLSADAVCEDLIGAAVWLLDHAEP